MAFKLHVTMGTAEKAGHTGFGIKGHLISWILMYSFESTMLSTINNNGYNEILCVRIKNNNLTLLKRKFYIHIHEELLIYIYIYIFNHLKYVYIYIYAYVVPNNYYGSIYINI